jgi:hypothetical protein
MGIGLRMWRTGHPFDGVGGDEHEGGWCGCNTGEYLFGRLVDAGATSFLSNGSG